MEFIKRLFRKIFGGLFGSKSTTGLGLRESSQAEQRKEVGVQVEPVSTTVSKTSDLKAPEPKLEQRSISPSQASVQAPAKELKTSPPPDVPALEQKPIARVEAPAPTPIPTIEQKSAPLPPPPKPSIPPLVKPEPKVSTGGQLSSPFVEPQLDKPKPVSPKVETPSFNLPTAAPRQPTVNPVASVPPTPSAPAKPPQRPAVEEPVFSFSPPPAPVPKVPNVGSTSTAPTAPIVPPVPPSPPATPLVPPASPLLSPTPPLKTPEPPKPPIAPPVKPPVMPQAKAPAMPSAQPPQAPKPVAPQMPKPASPATGPKYQPGATNDQAAQRLARLLVTEIKLYNEKKIMDGRKNNNIYDLLKDPIEQSRKHYKERMGNSLEAMPDYFHEELVKTLCEGDASKLGPNYTQS